MASYSWNSSIGLNDWGLLDPISKDLGGFSENFRNGYSSNSNISTVESNDLGLFDPICTNLGGLGENLGNGLVSISQSLVLDSEKGKLVKAPMKEGKKSGVSEAKSMAALKSHSEAERRRRERINLHLDKLRGLVACTEKMDKATLLAEVIRQMKQLKNKATEASKGLLIPTDTDEVIVKPLDADYGPYDGSFSVRASLCCDYRPELQSDLRQALGTLNLNIQKAEVSTLEGRVQNVFIILGREENCDNPEARQLLVNSVHRALTSVLDKGSSSLEYSPRTTLPNKRRKLSLSDSSSPSW